MKPAFFKKHGSATLEYVIISTFATLLSVAAVTFVGRMVKQKVDSMAEKLQIDATEFEFDLGFNQ
jgi:Flp pilus assembly pilin Flp